VKATQRLHELGQSLWLDNITRELLDSGQLQEYIDDYSVTGLTSNPAIFDKAIAAGGYDDAIQEKAASGMGREALFFELAIEDLRRAADAFAVIHERTAGVDGETLWAFYDHGHAGEAMPVDGGDANATIAAHEAAGIDVRALAARLQADAATASSTPGTT